MFTAYRGTYIRLVAPTSPAEVPIRPAATVVLGRDGDTGLEVLMVRRNRDAVFLGGAHVFPGGGVDGADRSAIAREAIAYSGSDEELPWRAAALRELFEEAGVLLGAPDLVHEVDEERFYPDLVRLGGRLDADRLEYFANWVTPLGPPRRFDTRFYAVGADPIVVTDDREVFDPEWVRPAEALGRFERDEWFLEIPTRATLEWMRSFESVARLLAEAAATSVVQVAPRISRDATGAVQVLMPGDPGFEEAPE